MPSSKTLNWRRASVFLLLGAILFFSNPGLSFFIVGSLLALFGEAIRVWAAGHLEKNKTLTTSGPYAFVRNPLYIGTLFIMMGILLASSSLESGSARGKVFLFLLLPLCLLLFFGYYFPYKIRVEGDRMVRRFGEAGKEWASKTPNLIPRLIPYEDRSKKRWQFTLFLKNSELETAFAVVLGLILVGRKFIPGIGESLVF